jgi:hypothetical protein
MASFHGGACVGIAGDGGAADDDEFLGGTRIMPLIMMRTLDVVMTILDVTTAAINVANASHYDNGCMYGNNDDGKSIIGRSSGCRSTCS